MRTVLVCVRTPRAAQTVASTAARLGMTGVVRTAVSETEAMIRLAERPAEVVLADTAVTRPDSVGFTRRVLARAPQAQVVLFGAEDPRVAAATVAGAARNHNSTAARGPYRDGMGGLGSPNAGAVPAMLPNSPMVPVQRGDAALDPV